MQKNEGREGGVGVGVWKHDSPYGKSHDWVFASPHTRGRSPYWPDVVLSRIIRPAAVRAGIQKHIGWHTFRHSFSTMLMANGENIKVVHELMRHANCRCTLEIYSQARVQAKRDAQHRVVEMIIPREHEANDTESPLILAKSEAARMELA
jgi:integrase